MGRVKEQYVKQYFDKLFSTDKSRGEPLDHIDFKGKVVCDLGCGVGFFSKVVMEKGAKKVYAVDFAREAIRRVKINCKGLRVKAIEMECKDLVLPEKIDVVVMLDVIEHIPPNEEDQVYEKVIKCLKNNGLLLITTNCIECEHCFAKSGKPWKAGEGDYWVPNPYSSDDEMHCNYQTKEHLFNQFRKYGLHIVKYYTFHAPREWTHVIIGKKFK